MIKIPNTLLRRAAVIAAALVLPAGLAAAGAEPQRVVREGVAIDFELLPLDGGAVREGAPASFRFTLKDENTGTPLSGVYPAAWMDRRPDDEAVAEAENCQDKVEAFIGGSLFAPPELDLNVYYVLALNDDATISVVDPLFGFGNTKLLDMVFLESPGEDWTLSDDQQTLYVTQPDASKVAVIDTATWEVTTHLEVAPRPRRLALQEDGRYLWVTTTDGVAVVDVAGLEVVKTIPTGAGRHEIAFSSGDRHAFVTSRDAGTLSVIEIATLEKVRELKLGAPPASIAFSPVAEAVYVPTEDGKITVVDGRSLEVVARAEAEPGLGNIIFAPGDRLAFIANPERDAVHILDAATNRVIQTASVEDRPDQVAFSDHLAYVRHQGSEIVLMIPLDQIGREGAPVPVIDFPGGQNPPGKSPRQSAAAAVVQAPGATAVLVANPTDRAIYFYKEGMAAPMGHFQNYGRRPRAALAVDRSLRERAPGRYETAATLRRPGRYDVAFFLDSPRTIHCFEVEVAADPRLEARRARVGAKIEARYAGATLTGGERTPVAVGQPVDLRLALTDPETGAPIAGRRDLRALAFRAPGFDRQNVVAEPLDDGSYRLAFTPGDAGIYFLFFEAPALGLGFRNAEALVFEARGEQNAATPSTPAEKGK